MFLKVKAVSGENVLVAVSDISSVGATKEGTSFAMKNGDLIESSTGFQAVGNRLAELDVQVA